MPPKTGSGSGNAAEQSFHCAGLAHFRDVRLLDGFWRRGFQHVPATSERLLVLGRFYPRALVSAPPRFVYGAEAIEDSHAAVSMTGGHTDEV